MDTETQATEIADSTTSTADKSTKVEDKKSYTQAELDKMFIERVNQAESATTAKLLKSLGVDKLEDATAAIKDAKTLKDAQLTETQRLEKERDEARKEADEHKAERLKIETERQLEKRDSNIVKALTKERANNPEDLLILMTNKKPDLVKAVMKEDGSVDEKALTALILATKQDYKTSFVGSNPSIPSNNNGKSPTGGKDIVLSRKVQA